MPAKPRRRLPQEPDSPGLVTGDCRQVLATLEPETVALTCIDPPYNIGYTYKTYNDKQPQAAYIAMMSEIFSAVHRVTKPDGSFWVVICDEQVSELDVLAKSLGWYKRQHVIWYYTFGVNSPGKFTRSHAHLLYYTKHKKERTWNPLRVPSARTLEYNDKRANPDGRNPDDTWILRPQWVQEGFFQTDDTWYIPRINGTFKERAGTPNQLPERLLGRIIQTCSNPGDLVMDPCAGSASTLITAKKLGRRFFGVELCPEDAVIGRQRLEAANVGDELAGIPPMGSA